KHQKKNSNRDVDDKNAEGKGIPISMTSTSMMTQAVKGKKLEDALKMTEKFSQMMLVEKIDPEDLALDDIIALEGVSKFPARIDCATLAWKAMEKGVKDQS